MPYFIPGQIIPVEKLNSFNTKLQNFYEDPENLALLEELNNLWNSIPTASETENNISDDIQNILDKQKEYIGE